LFFFQHLDTLFQSGGAWQALVEALRDEHLGKTRVQSPGRNGDDDVIGGIGEEPGQQ
jgi:hypothetical protein